MSIDQSPEELARIVLDVSEDYEVRKATIDHPDFPVAALTELVLRDDPEDSDLIDIAIGHAKMPESTLWAMVESDDFGAFYTVASGTSIAEVMERAWARNKEHFQDPDITDAIAVYNDACPESLLLDIVRYQDTRGRWALGLNFWEMTKHPSLDRLTPPVLEALVARNDEFINDRLRYLGRIDAQSRVNV